MLLVVDESYSDFCLDNEFSAGQLVSEGNQNVVVLIRSQKTLDCRAGVLDSSSGWKRYFIFK